MRIIFARKTELAAIFAATLVVGVALANLELSQTDAISAQVFQVLGGFIALSLVAHYAICLLAPQANQLLLPIAATLNGLGLVMLDRLDLALEQGLVTKQIVWSVVAVGLMIGTLKLVKSHTQLAKYSYVLGLAGLIMLALPMVWPIKANADANIWITLGPFSIQPGEFAKILLILFFAQLLTNKRAVLTVAGKKLGPLEFPRIRDLGPVLAVWLVAIGIMAGENDFGPALMLLGTVLAMLYIATSRAGWLVIGLALIAIGGTVLYQLSSKIQIRVENFLDPLAHYHTTGGQLSEALFAMSWGGLTGTGLGRGYPSLIPVVTSDFILSAIGEELGLVGLTAILLLLLTFVIIGMKTALAVKDSHGKLIASGLSFTLALQVFVVVGGISALMPMTGLTTPFMSQGGSSLMANYILLALLLRISNTANATHTASETPALAGGRS